ncbi:hypothetical protein ACFSUS_00820 [Spirosoma soli]|uniref:MarR family transcriptional regulator n=1 Tax=Spirosoma soli TaxID=1770529 RepID=A0ABW5LWJ6_9BACT
MAPTIAPPEAARLANFSGPSLSALLSRSEDDFYGRLQRIWNNVVQLEDLGFIRTEEDKFIYAYRFAEAELHQACTERETAMATTGFNVAAF